MARHSRLRHSPPTLRHRRTLCSRVPLHPRVPHPPRPPRRRPPPARRPAPARPPKPSRPFVICIDALNSAFTSSTRTRDALMNLFEKEKPGEASYVLLSIGRQLQVLQTATSDPAAILAKLRNPAVQN